MNNLNRFIEERLKENKSFIKHYSTVEFAASTAQKMSDAAAPIFNLTDEEIPGPDFRVLAIKVAGETRFTPVFMLSSWMNKYRLGGYLGYFAEKGFSSL